VITVVTTTIVCHNRRQWQVAKINCKSSVPDMSDPIDAVSRKCDALLTLKSTLGDLFQAQKQLVLDELTQASRAQLSAAVELCRRLRTNGFIESDEEMTKIIAGIERRVLNDEMMIF
jgi:hypothetical protein